MNGTNAEASLAVEDTDDENIEDRYTKVECDICGEECLDGETHDYSDRREYRSETGDYICLAYYVDSASDGMVHMCEACREEYVHVADCDSLIHTDSAVFVEDLGDWYSEEYAQDHFYYRNGDWYSYRPSGCLDYSERVTDHCTAHRPFRKLLVMGVELEMEARGNNEAVDLVEAIGGPIGDQWICTEDGSLTDGMEFNCMPLTLDEHKSGKHVDWKNILTTLQPMAKSGAGTTHCGMHVHINRKALTPLVIGKMLVFANSQVNENALATIFQRASCDYAVASQKKILDVNNRYHARCERINLCPSQTVEIRAFRGNLRLERVMKNLEFCHAMVTFCRDCSMRDVENWGAFAGMVARNKSVYPNLYAFMNEKGIAR